MSFTDLLRAIRSNMADMLLIAKEGKIGLSNCEIEVLGRIVEGLYDSENSLGLMATGRLGK